MPSHHLDRMDGIGHSSVMKIDMEISQWLCSRLCHDLASGVGAVMAGLEMLKDDGGDDAFKLAENSAQLLSDRLQFARLAFGYGAGENPVDVENIQQLAGAYVGNGKSRILWSGDQQGSVPERVSADCARSLLLAVIIGNECLIRGGTLDISLVKLAEGEAVAMEISGPGTKIRNDMAAILNGRNDAGGSSRNVHGLYLMHLVAKNDGNIEFIADGNDTLQLAFLLP